MLQRCSRTCPSRPLHVGTDEWKKKQVTWKYDLWDCTLKHLLQRDMFHKEAPPKRENCHMFPATQEHRGFSLNAQSIPKAMQALQGCLTLLHQRLWQQISFSFCPDFLTEETTCQNQYMALWSATSLEWKFSCWISDAYYRRDGTGTKLHTIDPVMDSYFWKLANSTIKLEENSEVIHQTRDLRVYRVFLSMNF